MPAGALVVVATPIGNLADLSPRARDELSRAALVLCEDTRRTGRLYELTGIAPRPPLVLCDDRHEGECITTALAAVARGDRVVLVSDAGTPAVSDPGQRLVAAAADAGHPVEVVPGPSAALAALVASGFPAARFCFEGFLPRKGADRRARVAEVAAERRPTVIFEAPHRLARTLSDLADACGGERRVAVARELTKMHEEVWRGRLADAVERAGEINPRGEHVLVVAGAPAPPAPAAAEIEAALDQELAGGRSRRDAAAVVAERLGVSRRQVYELAQGRAR